MPVGFYESGVEFDKIIHHGSMGGRKAVQQYLNTRIKMLRRHYGNVLARGGDVSQFLIVMEVLILSESLLADYGLDVGGDEGVDGN